MTTVFLLEHVHTLPDGAEDVKTIGIYSSQEEALAAIARLHGQPGFADTSEIIGSEDTKQHDGFIISAYEIDRDNWSEGFVTV